MVQIDPLGLIGTDMFLSDAGDFATEVRTLVDGADAARCWVIVAAVIADIDYSAAPDADHYLPVPTNFVAQPETGKASPPFRGNPHLWNVARKPGSRAGLSYRTDRSPSGQTLKSQIVSADSRQCCWSGLN